MDKADADQQATRAQQIVGICSLFFADQEPGVVGAALADLMAMFLCNHRVSDAVRAELLAQWCETVWKLVAVNDGMGPT